MCIRDRWYAAFHNEGHHPHVHLMVYSAKDNDGYLMEKSIEAMRSELAHDIFRQDFAHIYEQQNQTLSLIHIFPPFSSSASLAKPFPDLPVPYGSYTFPLDPHSSPFLLEKAGTPSIYSCDR